MDIIATISKELNLLPSHVQNVVSLLDDGKTVPFIARYRKELTGAMDDQVIRKLEERLARLRGIEKRRDEILSTLKEQNVLTPELQKSILNAETLAVLEDIYRPYKQKRKTRASMAVERGLEPLAKEILLQKKHLATLDQLAERYLSDEKGVLTADEALQGARDIIAEIMSNDVDCRSAMRRNSYSAGRIATCAAKDEAAPIPCTTNTRNRSIEFRITAFLRSTAANVKGF